jgi:peptide/nickel transport system ATP-binding protein/oligopeptide transport system ATP-binding protein
VGVTTQWGKTSGKIDDVLDRVSSMGAMAKTLAAESRVTTVLWPESIVGEYNPALYPVLNIELLKAHRIDAKNLLNLKGEALKIVRRDMQIIFQDPYASLDPRMRIGDSVMEGLEIHSIGNRKDRYQMAVDTLRKVGLEEFHSRRFPHEFSGGQRQRIGIARALALQPRFIICDEPVSALDVSIQSQVLNILKDLQQEFGLTYLFIAHNLGVVEHISDRVAVMYLGKMVELATREALFSNPLHPYTKALMSAIPIPNPRLRRERIILKGDVPSPLNPPSGCRFHPRCPIAVAHCAVEEPPFEEKTPGHRAACWLV